MEGGIEVAFDLLTPACLIPTISQPRLDEECKD
jgi:hypothetical protein